MIRYSKTSQDRLSTCHEDLQLIFSIALQSWDHTVLVGHRGKTEQNQAFISGKSEKAWPNSKHNTSPSLAVDVSPYPIPKNWGRGSSEELNKFRYFAFYVVGLADALKLCGVVRHSLRWGGDWDMDKDVLDNKFEDLVHFELVEV